MLPLVPISVFIAVVVGCLFFGAKFLDIPKKTVFRGTFFLLGGIVAVCFLATALTDRPQNKPFVSVGSTIGSFNPPASSNVRKTFQDMENNVPKTIRDIEAQVPGTISQIEADLLRDAATYGISPDDIRSQMRQLEVESSKSIRELEPDVRRALREMEEKVNEELRRQGLKR